MDGRPRILLEPSFMAWLWRIIIRLRTHNTWGWKAGYGLQDDEETDITTLVWRIS